MMLVFYTAKIHLGVNKIDSLAFQNVVSLKNASGKIQQLGATRFLY
jgi:hypothetical protein